MIEELRQVRGSQAGRFSSTSGTDTPKSFMSRHSCFRSDGSPRSSGYSYSPMKGTPLRGEKFFRESSGEGTDSGYRESMGGAKSTVTKKLSLNFS